MNDSTATVELPCPHCGEAQEPAALGSDPARPERLWCPRCARSFEAVRFEPPRRPVRVPRLAEAGPEAGHACANHEGNLAITNCERCGVFMCALCRIGIEGKTLCPSCFDRLTEAGELPTLRTRFQDYRGAALAMAAAGILLAFLGPLFGTLAIFNASRALRQARELAENEGRFGIYLAFGLGVVEILGGLTLWILMLGGLAA